jgi:hypothetical protein
LKEHVQKKTKPGQNHIKQHKTPHTEHEFETTTSTTTKAKNKTKVR